jgi:hypothetical protein
MPVPCHSQVPRYPRAMYSAPYTPRYVHPRNYKQCLLVPTSDVTREQHESTRNARACTPTNDQSRRGKKAGLPACPAQQSRKPRAARTFLPRGALTYPDLCQAVSHICVQLQVYPFPCTTTYTMMHTHTAANIQSRGFSLSSSPQNSEERARFLLERELRIES